MEHTVNKQQMDALKALADTNIKVSEAKATLIKLEETETEYLLGREEKAMARIQQVHDNSSALLAQTQTNYDQVNQIVKTVHTFCDALAAGYGEFRALLEDFSKRNEIWEENCKKWEESNEETRNGLKIAQASIESSRAMIDKDQKALDADRKKLRDERATLQRSIERLKNNRI